MAASTSALEEVVLALLRSRVDRLETLGSMDDKRCGTDQRRGQENKVEPHGGLLRIGRWVDSLGRRCGW